MPFRALFLAFFAFPLSLQAAFCTPTAAVLCVGADDIADVWINGTCVEFCLGDFPYIPGTSATAIRCITITPGLLNGAGNNSIAVRVRNTNPTEMWATFAFDITCAGGGHAYSTSSAGYELYSDPGGASPPPMQGGLDWFQPAYTPSPSWVAPTFVTATVFGKRALDPATGLPLPPVAADAAGSGPGVNDTFYFRRDFIVTAGPTPVPPTATPTSTPTPSATPTVTETYTSTATPTQTVSPSITVTFSITQTFTESPTFSPSPTISPTFSISQTFTPVIKVEPISLIGLYPNPFTDSLKIGFRSTVAGSLFLSIYNVAGEPVAGFKVQAQPGVNLVVWDGKNEAGSNCASGVYVLHMQSAENSNLGDFWATAAITR